jgi:hypothetical protein
MIKLELTHSKHLESINLLHFIQVRNRLLIRKFE